MNPLLLDIPDQMETERLIVRVARDEDAVLVHRAVRESLPALSQWMEWAAEASQQSVADTRSLWRENRAKFIRREELNYHLWRKSDGRFVGVSGVHHIDWNVPCFEVGYWLRSDLVGQGYMSEAVARLKRLLFEELGAERVESAVTRPRTQRGDGGTGRVHAGRAAAARAALGGDRRTGRYADLRPAA